MVHAFHSRRQLFANAVMAASRVTAGADHYVAAKCELDHTFGQ
jgi:hypothetical protein